jgi:hypothetical protein
MNPTRWCLLVAVASLAVTMLHAQAAVDHVADRAQIIQLERDWVQSFVTADTAANDRIVADDFFGTETDGRRIHKADLMAEVKAMEPLKSNHLNEDDVTMRFYSNVAVVNGSESWIEKSGKSGSFIWTDILVKRNGKWQVVASQDLEAPPRK